MMRTRSRRAQRLRSAPSAPTTSSLRRPQRTIYLAHARDKDPVEVGLVANETFTDIELTMNLGASNVTGSVEFGNALPAPYDRPIQCPSGAGQALRLEGADGKAAVRDNVVYDVVRP